MVKTSTCIRSRRLSNVLAVNQIKYLDDTEYRNQKARESLEHIKNELIYKDEMKKMSNYIDELLSKSKATSSNSKTMTKLISIIYAGTVATYE